MGVEVAETLGRRIAQKRKEKGWSQPQLAAAVRRINPELTTTASTICSIEVGVKSKRTKILPEIAQALGVSQDWLLTGFKATALKALPAPSDSDSVAGCVHWKNLHAAIEAALHFLGMDAEAAETMRHVICEVAEELPAGGEIPDPREARRILTEIAARKFLTQLRPR